MKYRTLLFLLFVLFGFFLAYHPAQRNHSDMIFYNAYKNHNLQKNDVFHPNHSNPNYGKFPYIITMGDHLYILGKTNLNIFDGKDWKKYKL